MSFAVKVAVGYAQQYYYLPLMVTFVLTVQSIETKYKYFFFYRK